MDGFGFKKYLASVALAFTATACVIGCSNTSSSDSAGIFIETNTGNKLTARVVVATDAWDLSAGDTVSLEQSSRDTVGDTIYVYENDYRKVVDSASVNVGKLALDSVPEGVYEHVSIYSATGMRTLPIEWNIDNGEEYYVDSTGITIVDTAPQESPKDTSDTANTADSTDVADSTDTPDSTNTSVDSMKVVDSASILLPEGFEDLSKTDEKFENMPFTLTLAQALKNPCLQDIEGNLISLKVADSDSSRSQNHYWGKLPGVHFSTSGSIDFKVLENCGETDSVEIALGTYVDHFENAGFMSESAKAKLEGKAAFMGNALWTDSTDYWTLINDFNPFVDGRSMTASFWLNMDSTMQAVPGSSYTRILSAKKDSVGFTVQQRGATGSINLRIDSHKNGVGDYNKTFGSAYNIMDGNWHNYAFTIRNDSVYVYVNGSLLEAGAFDAGENLTSELTPAIGGTPNIVGGIDELFFFDGTQSENWMRLFYALQAVNR